jgi:hypothetical protein
MFDRFKKPAEPRPNETPDQARPASGGFGRRQTPVNGAEHSQPAPPPSTGFGRRATPLNPSA